MDIRDKYGITPLMYAAGMGKTDVVRFLINQGADLSIRDKSLKRTFIGYADARGHWQLIMDALDTIQATDRRKVFTYFICDALMRLISRRTRFMDDWGTYFAKLVARGPDAICNIRFANRRDRTGDNNFLHFISSHEDVEALVRHGFKLFNQSNSAGNTAVFSLAGILDPTLLQSLLDHGTNINHVNHKGRSLLFLLLKQLRHISHRAFDVMDCVRICLRSGLDIFLSDCCRFSAPPKDVLCLQLSILLFRIIYGQKRPRLCGRWSFSPSWRSSEAAKTRRDSYLAFYAEHALTEWE